MTKEEKRHAVAVQAYPMLLKDGVEKFSLNNLLVKVGMSKGNFYHYFKHKNDLLYEVVVWQYSEIVQQYMSEKPLAQTFEEKLINCFSMYLSDSEQTRTFLKLIQDMHLIFANRSYEKLSLYIDQSYFDTFYELEVILEDEVEKGNIQAEAREYAKSISATADGMLLYSFMINEFDLNPELRKYFKNLAKTLAI